MVYKNRCTRGMSITVHHPCINAYKWFTWFVVSIGSIFDMMRFWTYWSVVCNCLNGGWLKLLNLICSQYKFSKVRNYCYVREARPVTQLTHVSLLNSCNCLQALRYYFILSMNWIVNLVDMHGDRYYLSIEKYNVEKNKFKSRKKKIYK